MTWPEYLAAAVAVVYLTVCTGYALQGQPGLALAYFAYALGNVGLIWAAIGGR